MKTKLLSIFAFAMLLTAGAYAQDSTAMSKKEMRQQKWDKRKTKAKEDLKVANDAVEKGAQKVGETVNKGLDKAETGLINERDKIRANRDSSKTEKARRDTL